MQARRRLQYDQRILPRPGARGPGWECNALAGARTGWISAHKVERRPNGNRRLHRRIEGRGGVRHELIAEMDHNTLHFDLIPAEQADSEAMAARR